MIRLVDHRSPEFTSGTDAVLRHHDLHSWFRFFGREIYREAMATFTTCPYISLWGVSYVVGRTLEEGPPVVYEPIYSGRPGSLNSTRNMDHVEDTEYRLGFHGLANRKSGPVHHIPIYLEDRPHPLGCTFVATLRGDIWEACLPFFGEDAADFFYDLPKIKLFLLTAIPRIFRSGKSHDTFNKLDYRYLDIKVEQDV